MRDTIFSPCRTYRYTLWRCWSQVDNSMFEESSPPRYAMFIGLNPSTADEKLDDPTIRRCIAFSKAWGFDGLLMTNLFAFRATDPNVMKKAVDPVGPANNQMLIKCAIEAGVVVAAWGNHGTHRGRDKEVCEIIKNLKCLQKTGSGQPSHPLYLPKHLKPIDFQ